MSDYITIPLSKRGKNRGKYQAIVSIEDAILAELDWTAFEISKVVYAKRTYRTNKQHTLLLHRVILSRKLERELLPTEQVDHINGNGLDNRRENLRLANKRQNAANTTKNALNTSGYKGAHYNKQSGKWQSKIGFQGKTLYLGSFATPELAHEAYCKKANELFGEYANYDSD